MRNTSIACDACPKNLLVEHVTLRLCTDIRYDKEAGAVQTYTVLDLCTECAARLIQERIHQYHNPARTVQWLKDVCREPESLPTEERSQ